MPPTESLQGFAPRLALYQIDERTRVVMQRIWPTVAPCLGRAIDDILAIVLTLPHLANTVGAHRDLVKTLEMSHFEALLGGSLDDRYIECCRATVQQETAIGFDARMRSTMGNCVLRAGIDALTRKYWFWPPRLAESPVRWGAALPLQGVFEIDRFRCRQRHEPASRMGRDRNARTPQGDR